MKIAILNLMPNKIETENHLQKSLGQNDYDIEFTFLRTATYQSKNSDPAYLEANYKIIDDVLSENFQGFICTGAPVETLPFESVLYMDELTQIIQWAREKTSSSYYICWGANVALYYFYGIEKILYEKKFSGVYDHKIIDPGANLMDGLSGTIKIPVSRFAGVRKDDIAAEPDLQLLLYSKESGPCLIASKTHNEYYNFNHFEYDADTLSKEYHRDIKSGMEIDIPVNYFPNDDPNNDPIKCWGIHGTIFFNNWLKNMYIYSNSKKTE